MKMRFLFVLLVGLVMQSCKQEEAPPLGRAKMQQILFDIHLAEAYSMSLHADTTRRNIERNKDSLAVFYRSVFQHHHITQKEFEQSMRWYLGHPEDLDSVYTRMIPEMSKLEALYN
jgi:hypothetical protein